VEHMDHRLFVNAHELGCFRNGRRSHAHQLPGQTLFTDLNRRHTHGGPAVESVYNPLLASRASFSSPSSTVSPGAYAPPAVFDQRIADVGAIR
jgi:hypothetical protein